MKQFLRGFNAGRNQAQLGMQISALRQSRNLSRAEFAEACGVKESLVKGLENCDLAVFLKSSIDDYTAICQYCDITCDISFTPLFCNVTKEFIAKPKTFEEEMREPKDELYHFDNCISYSILENELVYLVKNPIECSNLDHFVDTDVMINGNLQRISRAYRQSSLDDRNILVGELLAFIIQTP